jgi:hypothetical protein
VNGFPAIDPSAARRAERAMQARELVTRWTNALKGEQLSACMFSLRTELDDRGSLLIGAVDHELREQGYAIVSHSHTPIAENSNGVIIAAYTFLVRAIGKDAPRVLLA